MGIKELLGEVTKDADIVAVKKDKGGHKYDDEAEAVLEAIESKDKSALAEALELFFRNCDHDADDELDDDE